MRNRSVPTDTVLPHVVVQNLPAAIDWLAAAFGFVEHYRYGDNASGGAQMHVGDAYIMLHTARPGSVTPKQAGHRTQSLTIFVPDVDAHYRRASAAGAKMLEEVHETCYGERQYAAEDPDGHQWVFSQHASDLNPEDWGATLKK